MRASKEFKSAGRRRNEAPTAAPAGKAITSPFPQPTQTVRPAAPQPAQAIKPAAPQAFQTVKPVAPQPTQTARPASPQAVQTVKPTAPQPVKAITQTATSGKSAGDRHKSVTIEARIDVGFGNALYLRGEGTGLNWNQGVPLTCVDGSTWKWTGEVNDNLKFKLLLNDSVWAKGENLEVAPGEKLEISPAF